MPVKLSAFPKCYIDTIGPGKEMSLFEWIDMSVALEAQGLEIYSAFLDSFEPDYLAGVRTAVERHGMRISMFCCSPDLSHPDESVRIREIRQQETHMRAAASLGADSCRILSGQRHPDVDVKTGIDWVVSAIEEVLPVAHELEIRLAMENHYKDGAWQYPEFAQKKEVFFEIISRIDDPCFGVQFDPSNAVVAGDDPVAFLEQVKDRVISMHASDRFLLPGHTLAELAASDGNLGYSPILIHGVTGEGINDYDAIFTILAEIDYQGWISIEDGENGMDEMKQSIDFLRTMCRKYLGS